MAEAATARRRRGAGDLALLAHQVRAQNALFWRSPIAAFFTLAFPLIFLVLFSAVFRDVRVEGMDLAWPQFYTPGILVFAAVSASYTNLATTVAVEREVGLLKRLRGTPLPPWVWVAGRAGSAVWIGLIGAALLLAAGVLFFGVEVVWRLLPAALVTLVLGTACFCALGLAAASFAPSREAGSVIANFTILPLVFISDIFFPPGLLPEWLSGLAWLFPVKHFAVALRATFDPHTAGPGLAIGHLAVLLAWGLAGALVAARRFSWEPRGAGGPRRSRRGARAAR